jgi:hypothetical protein
VTVVAVEVAPDKVAVKVETPAAFSAMDAVTLSVTVGMVPFAGNSMTVTTVVAEVATHPDALETVTV